MRRQSPDGGTVVCKESLGPSAAEQSRNQRRLLEQLQGVPGVPRLAPGIWAANIVAMQDVRALPIGQAWQQPLPLTELIGIGQQLAQTLAGIHRRGVCHGDIHPSNVLVADGGRSVLLVDFDSASSGATPSRGPGKGEPAYMAPELTGRTGRAIDQRADLYGLGATLYRLATGQPPFVASDPLALVHQQLTRRPLPPVALRPGMPAMLSAIILRLLEKEPERRYQSAEGLALDLQRVATGDPDQPAFILGELDFPLRLAAPDEPVGREAELRSLQAVLDQAVQAGPRGVLLSGAPGVGKTTLVEQLRPMAAARQGWFVSGKFGLGGAAGADGVQQALGALAGLLLAQPEQTLAAERERILAILGSNAAVLPEWVPDYRSLLGIEPLPAQARASEARMLQTGVGLLRAVASTARPLVLVLDDVQWAGMQGVRFVDALMSEPNLPGLLLVVAFRDCEVGAGHPLVPMLDRWERRGSLALRLSLPGLAPPALAAMLQRMLRLAPAPAARLAGAIAPRTGGNPYDTVEFVNALRRDGVLSLRPRGWQWNDAAIRRHLGHGDVVALLNARIRHLPQASQYLLAAVACLGGQAPVGTLQAACALADRAALEATWAPALQEGLLVPRPGGGVRFPHDRVHEATYGLLQPRARAALHLELARRLAAVPGLEPTAAAQYLPAIEEIGDAQERRRVAILLRDAAAQCRLTQDAAAARFLAAALRLATAVSTPAEAAWLADIETALHAALYRLGRLAEADEVYESVEGRGLPTLLRADAVCVQISSLSNRGRHAQAMHLGIGLLRDLGLAVPTERLQELVQTRLDDLYLWVEGLDPDQGPHVTPMSDARMLAAAGVMDRMLTPAFFHDPTLFAWLVLESHRLWGAYGPCPALVGLLCSVPTVTGALRGDYRIGYAAARHGLAASEFMGWEPETSRARHIFSFVAVHWFEPLEQAIRQAQRAREGLLQGGDLQFACFTFHTALVGMFDSAPTLEACAAETEAGLAFAGRTGNEHANTFFLVYRQLLRALRGETAAPGSLSDAGFDAAELERKVAATPSSAAVLFHANCALAAALFGQDAALARHSEAAVSLLRFTQGGYRSALVHLLRAMSLARQAREPDAPRRRLLKELAACVQWLGRRAQDAPVNFGHLHRLVQAEAAWAHGHFREAVLAFDQALHEAAQRPRPWHRALIAERAAQFHFAHGMQREGRAQMAEALAAYESWGAQGKVRQLLDAFPDLVPAQPLATLEQEMPSRAAIDLQAVVRASQALSSQTSLESLQAQVVELLGAITGASTVRLLLREDGGDAWNLATGEPGSPLLPLDEAARRGLVPLGPVRYVQRAGQLLVVDDALHDDRFAAEPYFAGLDSCALMLLPITRQGACNAILLLESRRARSSFSAESAHAAGLIAGQLAVSLENARLYESLERKVAQRTHALARLNEQLEGRVLQRTAQLAQANQELQAFAYSLAHDLRTPLMSIAGFAKVLEEPGQDAVRRSHYGERIRAGVEQMGGLIEALLSLAAVSHAQLSSEEVDLALQAEDWLAEARRREPDRRVDTAIQQPLKVRGDRRLLRQLMEQLLSNAWKFSAGCEPGRIEVGAQEDAAGETVYFVRDNGVGFDMAYAGKLFQPFHRLHTTDQFPGIGIGLANARRIVGRHGGRIWTRAEPGGGATFYFTLGTSP